MFLYYLHDCQYAAMSPWGLAASGVHAAFESPLAPVSYTPFGRAVAACAEMTERSLRSFAKPAFMLDRIKSHGQCLRIREEVVASTPFCHLLHFCRTAPNTEGNARLAADPRVLIVAPLSGQHATLLRGTVEAMLPEHDVFITDWIDPKLVPLAQGSFDLEDNIAVVMEFLRQLGPEIHVMSICQASVPVLCAVALMADEGDSAQPRSMILLGGPIDTRLAPTALSLFAKNHSLDWFKNSVIQAVPFYYPGAFRLVYPGFLQLQGFMSMHLGHHLDEHIRQFRNLVRGDGEAANAHRRFYDEYLSVMNVTAEFYLQTIERVFKRHDLPNGAFRWRDRLVKPKAIQKTALLTVEGEMDDISAAGQTRPAHDLCSSLPASMKQAHYQIGVGHFGVFNGRVWRNSIQPVVRDFIRAHNSG